MQEKIEAVATEVPKYEPKFKGRLLHGVSVLFKKVKSYEATGEEEAMQHMGTPGLATPTSVEDERNIVREIAEVNCPFAQDFITLGMSPTISCSW